MEWNTHHRNVRSSSSPEMESSEIRTRIINLGKLLVEELDFDSSVDTLARWMAHYIAEQLIIAEKATGDDKIEAEQQCFDKILKLWQHRMALPNGCRPFESYEHIFRALEKLDPENNEPYFYHDPYKFSLEPDKTNKITESVQKWLDVASDIDQVARLWLDYVFKQAVLCATDEKTLEWLKKSIGLGDSDDESIIIRLLPDNLLHSDEIPAKIIKKRKRELINDRIKKLESVNDFNQKLLSIFMKELEDISEDDASIGDNDFS